MQRVRERSKCESGDHAPKIITNWNKHTEWITFMNRCCKILKYLSKRLFEWAYFQGVGVGGSLLEGGLHLKSYKFDLYLEGSLCLKNVMAKMGILC